MEGKADLIFSSEKIEKWSIFTMAEEITLLPVREFPDRGTKWLLESAENTSCLIRIIAANLAECIAFSRLHHIPTTFIPDNLRKQESDVIFLAPFLDQVEGTEREVMIYVLIEHQSDPRWEMGFRMFFYMAQICSLRSVVYLKP